MSPSLSIIDQDGRTHRFPPPLVGDYPVREGRVRTRSLEAHVVDHCNLTCAECCSLSPLLPARMTEPAALAHDLGLARRVLAPAVFKLVGGEPLLHPRLIELVHVARRSEIAPTLSLTTNGLLLPRMPDALWESLDAMTISRYPTPALPERTVAHATEQAARFGVRLNWKQQDRFVKMSVDEPRDPAQIAQTYSRCWLRERCHLVRDGRLYTCTRPVHFQSLYGQSAEDTGDGLPLTDCAADDVLAYLHREEPLAACAECAGGDAPMFPHRLLSADQLRRQRQRRADAARTPPAPA